MTRLALAAVVLCGLVNTAAASRPEAPPLPRPAVLPTKTAPVSAAVGDFVLDRDAEVLVDGKRCAFKEVPKGARVARIEVGEDRRTILRIEFVTN